MKRSILISLAAMLCFWLISCDGSLPGIGDDRRHQDGGETEGQIFEESNYEIIDIPLAETTWQTETSPVPDETLEWKNFVLVSGVMYSSTYADTTVDASQIGEKIGEITYRVTARPDTSEAQADYTEAQKAEFAAAYRDVGCGVYRVIGDENAIAVLDGGVYYLYILEG